MSSQDIADALSDSRTTNRVSISNFVKAILSNFAIALFLLLLFCILRPHIKRVYAPRTYAIEDRKRVPALKKGLFSWVLPTISTSNDKIMKATNLDCYMVLRTIKFMTIFFSFASLFSIALILPINVNFDARQDLSRFSAANVSRGSEWFWVHLTYYSLSIKSKLFIKLRHKQLIKDSIDSPLKSRTIMLCGLGKDLTDSSNLRKVLMPLPGIVQRISFIKDTKKLEELIRKRDNMIYKLEVCLSAYIIKIAKKFDSCKNKSEFKIPDRPFSTKTHIDVLNWKFSKSSIDIIDHYSNLLLKYNKNLRVYKKQNARALKPLDCSFVTFSDQISAHLSIQALLYHKINQPSLKLLDTAPADIVWKNLGINQINRRIRGYISLIISFVIILTWGSLSFIITSFFSANSLKKLFNITQTNDNFLAGLSAFIAPLLLAGLVAILPNFLRYLVDLEGTVRHSSTEFEVSRRFFWFLALTVFILPQISSTFNGLINKFNTFVNNPTVLLNQINEIFLNSSSFFITYIGLKSVVGSTVFLVNIPALFMRTIKPWLFSVTPRKRFQSDKPQRYEWEACIPHLTAVLYNHFNKNYLPLFKYLPVSIAADKKYNNPKDLDSPLTAPLIKPTPLAPNYVPGKTDRQGFTSQYSESLTSINSLDAFDYSFKSLPKIEVNSTNSDQNDSSPSVKIEINSCEDLKITKNDTVSLKIADFPTSDFKRLKSHITNGKLDSFLQPSLQSNSYSLIWVPDDKTGFINPIIDGINDIGKGYFKVFSKSAFVNKRYRIGIDFDFNFGEREGNYLTA
ncbi:hypothetical protein BB561_002218 [Smittium simulii]|uniref:CSC1/OSCA1-like 7TM region domain-containing protein n=1 Tax=Smittium simulii TaxID=133385 RepID=A0A2T9YRH1_9FUNG|nr:hypothetical protein BB561_002218 [Smittium simulii]